MSSFGLRLARINYPSAKHEGYAVGPHWAEALLIPVQDQKAFVFKCCVLSAVVTTAQTDR